MLNDVDSFMIRYKVNSTFKDSDVAKEQTIKWHIDQKYDVSTSNCVIATLNMQKQLINGTYTFMGLFEKFIVWSIILLSVVSMVLNSSQYVEMAKVFSSIT